MMTAPAMRASNDLYCARTCPTSVEIAPRVMKTMLKPMMNAAEFSITLRNSCPSFNFSCSTPTPEIRETYPGTSGSTQGDRNEISPATNTASGSGKLDIRFYCSGQTLNIGRNPELVVIAISASAADSGTMALRAAWQSRPAARTQPLPSKLCGGTPAAQPQ